MIIRISSAKAEDKDKWDQYVATHGHGLVYHLAGWREVISATYGHKAHYLVALIQKKGEEKIVGILPLIQLKHFYFGNRLVSMPYLDAAGILADSPQAEELLFDEAGQILRRSLGTTLEIRQNQPLTANRSFQRHIFSDAIAANMPLGQAGYALQLDNRKVGMCLNLPHSSKELFAHFKSKLRSQVRKPLKRGLHARIGGMELLDDFYSVLSANMRDLGSPVHSKKFFHHILSIFHDQSNIVLVSKGNRPLAGSMVFGYRSVLSNPWASALKKFNYLSPNMLLYWTMLEYACDQGYSYFDFGRSTPDEGTYKFKEQWGAESKPLYWYYINDEGNLKGECVQSDRLRNVVKYWKKLPIPLTKILGPKIRKHIGL